MKKVILILTLLFVQLILFAQTEEKEVVLKPLLTNSPWVSGTSNIYYNGGNVGIGTSSPVQKLQVEGNLRLLNSGGYIQKVKGLYFTWSSSYGTQFNHGIFSADGTSYSDDITLNSYGNVRINFDSNSNGTNKFSIGHHTTGLSNTLFTVAESGNVGIGVTNPKTSLEIYNGVLKLRGPSYDGQGGIHASAGARFMIDTEVSTAHGFLSFRNNNGVQMYVTCDGRLMCNRVETKEVWVENIALPDYVFEENYLLRDLKEVKEYIDTNGHLPDVPSANKVAKEGIGLKEMNNILLQKVEELTLYIIQMENRISELENK